MPQDTERVHIDDVEPGDTLELATGERITVGRKRGTITFKKLWDTEGNEYYEELFGSEYPAEYTVDRVKPSAGPQSTAQGQSGSADRVPEIQRRTETAVNQLFGPSITQELTVDENRVQIDGYLEDDEFATYRERMDDIAEFERTSGGQGQNVVQEPALDEMGVPQDVNFRRAQSDGQYTPPEPLIDPAPQAENVDRGPNGQFVDDDRQPIDEFGRDPLAGLFDPFDRL